MILVSLTGATLLLGGLIGGAVSEYGIDPRTEERLVFMGLYVLGLGTNAVLVEFYSQGTLTSFSEYTTLVMGIVGTVSGVLGTIAQYEELSAAISQKLETN